MSNFPSCTLHAVNIVDSLPDKCILRTQAGGAYKALHALQERGYRKLGRLEGTDPTGLDDLARYETCYECVGRLASHPLVRMMRGDKPVVVQPTARPAVTPSAIVGARTITHTTRID